jgi:hypothetical protein
MTSSITFGTSYYPDHWPRDEWQRDLELIRQSGITAVRFGEFSWSWIMPRPDVYDFAPYDHFMDLAERCGLKVLLCTPTCNPPPWFFARYPDARQIDQHARPHIGHRHMACYNHPAALAAAQDVVIKLGQQYRDHPALVGWQVDNELTAGESADLNRLYDYHPITLAHYRAYLQQRYESLEALNTAWWNNFWSNRYSSWEEIDPPRPGLSDNISPAMWLEWLRFRAANVAVFGRKQVAWLREIREDFQIGTNVPEVSPLRSVLLGQDYWELCQEMDFIGTDVYVYSGNTRRDQQQLAYSCDVIRSAATASGAKFGVLETQAGPHVRPWRMNFAGGYWKPDFLEHSSKTYAAHGADFVYFFLWRPTQGGAEFGMNGLVHTDGSPSERSQRLPQIIAAATTARDQLADRPPAYVHYSPDSLSLLALYDPDDTGDKSLPGWHSLLEDLGYRVTFLNDDDVLHLDHQPPGPVVLAQSIVLSQALCEKLAVPDDAHPLIVAGAPAYFDEYARVYEVLPGSQSLRQRIGISITALEAGRPLKTALFDTEEKPILQALVTAEGGHVLQESSDGSPSIVRGQASLYFHFDVGTAYYSAQEDTREDIRSYLMQFIGLFDQSSVSSPGPSYSQDIHVEARK